MNRPVHRCAAAPQTIATYDSASLQARLGPAEAQYGDQVIVLAPEGAQGALSCGATVFDNGLDDLNPNLLTVQVNTVWNDIHGETGYRYQVSNGTTFTSEFVHQEYPAGFTNSYLAIVSVGPTVVEQTVRVFGHVGHAPDHGPTPIEGDVVSNECALTFVLGEQNGPPSPSQFTVEIEGGASAVGSD